MAFQKTIAKVTSFALRACALLFFRLFPAHFPTIIFALFAVYAPAFVASYLAAPDVEILNDEVDVSIKTASLTPDSSLPSETATTADPEVVEEIEVEEKVLFLEHHESPWSVLLLGAPSTARPKLSLLTFIINLLLVGLTADALYRARWFFPVEDLSFVRVGYVSPTEARLLLREPDQTKMPVELQIRPKSSTLPSDRPVWRTAGRVMQTTNETDFTHGLVISLGNLDQQRFEWKTSNNHSGEFLTPPRPGHVSTIDGKFTFLSTSCILPRFPYNPLDHALAIPGLRHLADKLPELRAQFMLFLGDFIYVDVPERFGKSTEEYRMQYRQVYASPDWAAVAQNLSWIHVLDDHEISNDWSSNQTGIYHAAVGPWHNYQASVNPPAAVMAGTRSQRREGATWYEFVQGPASFFMLDTRSYRSSNNAPFDAESKTMLGANQLADFLAWLSRPEPKGVKWKIVASSVPFTKNWPVNVKDTWGGFLTERRRILEAMWDAGAHGSTVVILSGDRHEFAATRFPPPAQSKWSEEAAAFEFSTSPLNQFASPFPTYKQTDDEDVKLHYIPSGTSKFGSFTIENVDGRSTLRYRLFIDGVERWTTQLTEAPVPEGTKASGSVWDRIRFW